jgi:Flp pilus assembly protein TadD
MGRFKDDGGNNERPAALDVLKAYGRRYLVFAGGEPARARLLLEQAVTMEPRRSDARNNLGVACKRLGDLPAALAQFDATLVLAAKDETKPTT